MEVFNESFSQHCDEITAAMRGDEAMRKKHPDYANLYAQLQQLLKN